MGLTMKFLNPLRQAVLLKRYKRFLADVQLVNGEVITIHCPNTGAMTGCAESGMKIWMSDSSNPKRKYRYTWELAQTNNGDMICVNTHRANQLAGEALDSNIVPALSDLANLVAERKYGYDNRRIDWCAEDAVGQTVFIEVKSVTLAEGAQGFFPDTVSKRAFDHLRSLQDMKSDGHRAVVLYVVMHEGIKNVQAAHHLDAKYAAMAAQAEAFGVEFYALSCDISEHGITPTGLLPMNK